MTGTVARVDIASLPAPLAMPYRQALDEDHVQLRFRMLIKAFAGTLRYCALLVLADYLRLREAGTVVDPGLDRLFVDRIERPSLGHWNEFLREVLKAFRDRSHLLFVPELFAFYYKTPRPNAGLKAQSSVALIDEMIGLRNKYVHPDIYPPDPEAMRVSERSIELLEKLFGALGFLRDYPLERTWEADGTTERCQGLMPPSTARATQRVSFRVLSRDAATALRLGTFVYYGAEGGGRALPMLLYETLMGRRVKYLLGNDYVILEERPASDPGDGDPVRELRTLLGSLGLRLQEGLSGPDTTFGDGSLPAEGATRIGWEVFRQRAEGVSEPVYQRFLREGKYNGKRYVARKEIDVQVQEFLEGSHRAAILVAESGFGKTSFLCSWYQRLKDASHAVVFLTGRGYGGLPIAGLMLAQFQADALFRQIFKGSALDLLRQLGDLPEVREGGRKVVVLVDAVNEAPEPDKMFDELCRFIDAAAMPWLKVLLTIRTFVWNSVKDRHPLDPSVYFGTQESSEAPAPHIDLPRLSAKELEAAFGLYSQAFRLSTPYSSLSEASRKLLSNPLLLRFAAEAYQGQALPPSIFSHKIFEQYRQERVSEKDTYFLDYLAEAMWRMRRDYLLFSDFDLDVAPGSETWLLQPSVLHPSADSLAIKLRDYAFSDPVYEQAIVTRCENPVCPSEYNRELAPTELVGQDGLPITKCPACHQELKEYAVDVRTTYVRLRSENIVQEFEVGKELALRFTYDRWFEFLLGHMITKIALEGEGAPPDAARFLAALGSVRTIYVFWGAFKNVVLDYLRRVPCEDSFWRSILTPSPTPAGAGVPQDGRLVATACRHIMVSALLEYADEDRARTRAFLAALSSPQSATPESLGVALEAALALALDSAEVRSESPEVEVVRRGLRSADPTGRTEACRVAFALAQRSPREGDGVSDLQGLVLDLMDELGQELRKRLSGTAILGLASAATRDTLRARVDSLTTMSLHLLGSRFSETSLRQRLLTTGVGLIRHLMSHPVLRLLRRPLAGVIADKLSKVYWQKGPLPCNHIEMHLSLAPGLQQTTAQIGEFFRKPESHLTKEPDLNTLCGTENGLISWYMYSLLASHGHRSEQRQDVLRFLESLYEEGNHVARYVAATALWILADFSDAAGPEAAPVYERVSRRFLGDYGGWITFRHDVPIDDVCARYLDEPGADGARRTYWARRLPTGFECRYTNSALANLSEYTIRRHEATQLDVVPELLGDERWHGQQEMVAYCVDALGDVGARYPFPVLKTYQTLVERFVEYDVEVPSHGKTVKMRDVLTAALIRMKSVHPTHVNRFVEGLDRRHFALLRSVLLATPEAVSDSMDSYYGEVVYQKSFLEIPEARAVFGDGIVDSARARNVHQLFVAFARRVIDRAARES